MNSQNEDIQNIQISISEIKQSFTTQDKKINTYSSASDYSIEANRSIELAISKISYKHRVEVIQI